MKAACTLLPHHPILSGIFGWKIALTLQIFQRKAAFMLKSVSRCMIYFFFTNTPPNSFLEFHSGSSVLCGKPLWMQILHPSLIVVKMIYSKWKSETEMWLPVWPAPPHYVRTTLMLDVKIIDEGVLAGSSSLLPLSVIFQHFLPHFSNGGSRIDHESTEEVR